MTHLLLPWPRRRPPSSIPEGPVVVAVAQEGGDEAVLELGVLSLRKVVEGTAVGKGEGGGRRSMGQGSKGTKGETRREGRAPSLPSGEDKANE